MRSFLILSLAAVALSLSATAAKPHKQPSKTLPKPLLRIGVFADCQYGDKDETDERSYRGSKERLARTVDYLNEQKVALTISLGDMVENDPAAISELLPYLGKIDSATYHLLGNHDFYPDTAASHTLHRALKTSPNHRRSVERGRVRLLMLNTNDRTLYAADTDSLREDALRYADSLRQAGDAVYPFNGAVDSGQIAWMESQLEDAKSKGQIVILFSHHPLKFFLPNAVVRNSEQICSLIERYKGTVVAHLSGHLHYGGRTLDNGVHYLIIKGMVQKESENFASVLSIFDDHLEISSIDGTKSSLKYRNIN